MAEKKQQQYFPSQRESEKVLEVIRRHWFTYVIMVLFGAAILTPLIVLSVLWANGGLIVEGGWLNISVVIVSILILSVLGLLIYGFIDYYLDVYILTDRRIVDISQNGFFRRKISELNIRQVQDVNAEVNGLFATIFHFGDVYIQTAGEKENFIFRSVPHPYRTSKKILNLHEAYLASKQIGEEINELEDEKFPEPSTISSESVKKIDKEQQRKIIEGINNCVNEECKLEENKEVDIQ